MHIFGTNTQSIDGTLILYQFYILHLSGGLAATLKFELLAEIDIRQTQNV